jgi:hypothetical protein
MCKSKSVQGRNRGVAPIKCRNTGRQILKSQSFHQTSMEYTRHLRGEFYDYEGLDSIVLKPLLSLIHDFVPCPHEMLHFKQSESPITVPQGTR